MTFDHRLANIAGPVVRR